jgi:hypothetical protein
MAQQFYNQAEDPARTRTAPGWHTVGFGDTHPTRGVGVDRPAPGPDAGQPLEVTLERFPHPERVFPQPSRRISSIRFGAIFWPVFTAILAAIATTGALFVAVSYLALFTATH